MTRDYRYYSEQSRTEALALLDRIVEEVPVDAAALMEDLRRRGGPADALDYSRDSLLALWSWFLESNSLPRSPATDEEMRASSPPWWYDFTLNLAGRELGPDLSRLATRMAAYFAETLIRHRPESRWVLDDVDPKDFRFNEPLLNVPGTAPIQLFGIVISTAWGSLDPTTTNSAVRRPHWLRDRFDSRIRPEVEPMTSPATAEPVPPWTVEAIEDEDDPRVGAFTHDIGFDDVVAHEEEDRVAAFVEAMGREDGVDEAIHEDRGLVILRAPSLDVAALEAIVARVWDACGRSA